MPLYQLPRAGSVVVPPLPDVGQYLIPLSAGIASSSNVLGNGTLRLSPWLLRQPMRIDRIGSDVASVGESGSKFRIGIYLDSGNCTPGALLLDAGQVAADSATVQDLTCDVWLPAGVIWLGGAVQSAPSTQPTMRTHSAAPPLDVVFNWGSSTPTAGGGASGWTQSSVTGALPDPWTGSGGGVSATMPRLHVRRA